MTGKGNYIEQYCVENDDGSLLVQLKVPPTGTADLKQIIGDHLLTWSDLFAFKNAGYGDMADDLGSRAQFVDINRKVKKLRRALWLQQPLTGETEEEIVQDLIGHCFLMLVQLRREAEEGPPVVSAGFDPSAVSRPVGTVFVLGEPRPAFTELEEIAYEPDVELVAYEPDVEMVELDTMPCPHTARHGVHVWKFMDTGKICKGRETSRSGI